METPRSVVQIENVTMEKIAQIVEDGIERKLNQFGRHLKAYLEEREGGKELVTDNMDVPPIYYSVKEVCTMLGVTRQTLHAWVKKGLISGSRYGRTLRFSKTDLDKANRGTGK